MMLHPNSDLVARAWLLGVPGLGAGMVGSELPQENATWAASGFVQVTTGVGGSPAIHVPMRGPVVQLDFWAVNPSSSKPPWGKANQLAELVLADLYAVENPKWGRRKVAMPVTGYRAAIVSSVYAMSEPRRAKSDAASYARYQMDVTMRWTEVPE